MVFSWLLDGFDMVLILFNVLIGFPLFGHGSQPRPGFSAKCPVPQILQIQENHVFKSRKIMFFNPGNEGFSRKSPHFLG